jgi:hypothetical protein
MAINTATRPSSHQRLPLPLATAGIGLLASFSLPGGLTGGQGFVVGLVVGAGALAVAALLARRAAPIDRPERASP